MIYDPECQSQLNQTLINVSLSKQSALFWVTSLKHSTSQKVNFCVYVKVHFWEIVLQQGKLTFPCVRIQTKEQRTEYNFEATKVETKILKKLYLCSDVTGM